MPDSLPRRSFWKRRFRDPIFAMLTHGVTADKVAATFAIGTAVSLFPVIGLTTTFNIGIGLWFRMNQPLLQAINYLLTPVHLVMIIVYVHLGEWIWRAGEDRFSVSDLITSFHKETLGEFIHRFGWAGIHAFTAWLISVPFIISILYYSLRPLMRRLAQLGAINPS